MEKFENLLAKISDGDNDTLKKLYGNDPEVLQAQEIRYKGLLLKFSELFNNKDAELFSSPGRTEIGGNHTDHNHGRVLAGAVNLDNIAAVSKNNSNVIRIVSIGYPQFEVTLSGVQKALQSQDCKAFLLECAFALLKVRHH